MNSKVVVVWVFVIIVCFGMGLFGYFNRDLMVEPTVQEEYIPIVSEVRAMTCRSDGKPIYQFSIDNETNQIKQVFIRYENSSADIDTYAAASNINNSTIDGVTSVLSGSSTDVTLSITVDLSTFNSISLSSISTDIAKLNLVIEPVFIIEEYQNLLNQTGTVYTCE